MQSSTPFLFVDAVLIHDTFNDVIDMLFAELLQFIEESTFFCLSIDLVDCFFLV